MYDGDKLTIEQREFAQKKHYVLEQFLKSRGLPYGEYYDVVVFAFLRAVAQFNTNSGSADEFERLAARYMTNALGAHRKQIKQERRMTACSLNAPIVRHCNLTYGDIIADVHADVYEDLCDKLDRDGQSNMKYLKFRFAFQSAAA